MTSDDTKTRILDEAETLIQLYGYQGFSYKQIADKLNVRNAAIHYHFPAKADLGTAYVERLLARFGSYRDHMNAKYPANATALLNAFIALPLNYISKPGMTCPLGVLEADHRFLPPAMLDATARLGRAMRAWLQEILEQGRAQGRMQFNGDAVSKALAVWAMLQGASLMAASSDVSVYQDIVRRLFVDLAIAETPRTLVTAIKE